MITGHSLGAGTTGILSLIWMSDPEIMNIGFTSFCFAPPLCFSAEFNEYLRPYVMSCVLGNDLVPRLSFGSVRDMIQMVDAWRKMDNDKRATRSGNIVAGRIYNNRTKDSELIETYYEIKANFNNQKLSLPGVVFQIYDEERNTEYARFEGKSRSHYKGAFIQE